MKAAALIHSMRMRPSEFEQILVHTGQHYDHQMSRVFFDELDLPEPNSYLDIGSGTHAIQTAHAMSAFEPVLLESRPDVVVVVGDVNSTLACALVATKLGFPVAHVEAGLRSFDRSMPEEINRILTDQLADFLFTPSRDANDNLRREGVDERKIHFVGNVMIDTLVRLLPKVGVEHALRRRGLQPGSYVLVTLHRPSNVDNEESLGEIMTALAAIAREQRVIFPVHPRTRSRIEQLGLERLSGSVQLEEPLSYLEFLELEQSAFAVLTDSGGVQEETTYLGVPCLTLRPNTERPVTVRSGTNRLVASRYAEILEAVRGVSERKPGQRTAPELWDGRAGERIAQVLYEHCRSSCLEADASR